jgi:hypothetical protein
LFVWYAIATVIFRCPPTIEDCDDDTPSLCTAYFQAKSTVAPYVKPYFDQYAAPYIEVASPYAAAVSKNVVKPTRDLAVHYGAPRLAQAQAYAQAQWLKTGKPQVDKLRATAQEQYRHSLGPHVDRAAHVISPYLDMARTSALQTYYEVILPTYDLVKPYAVQAYDAACVFTTDIAIPSVSWAFDRSYAFLDDNVLPHIRAVYVEQVEPQLIRIGERLGRYKGSPTGHPKKIAATSRDSKLKSATASTSASASVSEFRKPSQPAKATFEKPKKAPKSRNIFSKGSSASGSSASSETVSNPAAASADDNIPVPKQQKPSKEEVMRIARETVVEDLELWQTKFTKAADEGAAEIEASVTKISQRFRKTRVDTTGALLVSQLEKVSHEEMETLKKAIVSIVEKQSGQEVVDMTAAADEIVAAVRRAGLGIKGKAEEVRNWREEFEQEIHQEVTGAAQEHFNILGGIRDLALQKIGMKWAWMDGITYKDWAKYHDLKRKFEEWTEDLQQLIVSHPDLEAAMDAASSVEDRAMEVAQQAAAELGRLKEVAGWKIMAGDASDSFDSEAMEKAAEAASGSDEAEGDESPAGEPENTGSKESLVDWAKEAVKLDAEPVQTLLVTPEELVDEKKPVVVEEAPAGPSTHDDANDAPVGADHMQEAKTVPKPELVEPEPEVGKDAEPNSSTRAEEPVEAIQSPVMDALPVVVGNLTEAIENAPSEPEKESERAPEAETVENAPSGEKDDEAAPLVQPVQDPASVKAVPFGAAAQDVPGRQIVFDDEADSKPAKPTETSAPLVDWAAVESVASAKLEEGRLWAEQQYEMAKIALGLATPTPTPASNTEKLLELARMNYYAGLGFAHARYNEFMLAASSALGSVTATPTPTPTNLLESASSVASVAGESAASAAQAVRDSVHSVVDEAESAVVQSWEVIVSHISVRIYGAPTPTAWYDGIYSLVGHGSGASETATNVAVAYAASATHMAAEQYSAVSSIISELILGKEPPYTQSIFSRLNAVYTAGANMAGAATSAVASVASVATEAVKEQVGQAKDEL